MLAVGSVVAAVVLTIVVRDNARSTNVLPAAGLATAGESVPAADEELMNFVADVTSSMPYEEIQQAAEPTVDATDAMVAQLTPKERAELVRLLKAQIRSDD